MKRIGIMLLIVGTIFISGCSCSKQNGNDDNSNKIVNKEITEPKEIDGIIFENTTFEVKDELTTIVTKVKNNTGSSFYLENFQIIITDKDGMMLTILTQTVDENLESNQEVTYNNEYALDLSNAHSIEYKVNVPISG